MFFNTLKQAKLPFLFTSWQETALIEIVRLHYRHNILNQWFIPGDSITMLSQILSALPTVHKHVYHTGTMQQSHHQQIDYLAHHQLISKFDCRKNTMLKPKRSLINSFDILAKNLVKRIKFFKNKRLFCFIKIIPNQSNY